MGLKVVFLNSVRSAISTQQRSTNKIQMLRTEDKEKRRFLYVVAIDMHERGLLDGHSSALGFRPH